MDRMPLVGSGTRFAVWITPGVRRIVTLSLPRDA